MTRSAPTSWRPDPEVLARRLDEEMVLVHLGTAEVFTLNRTAARLWELIERVPVFVLRYPSGRAQLPRVAEVVASRVAAGASARARRARS